jgi:UDP-N-acetylmuramoyl-L-alanyl-D-glutamate--2,6-diaminopimelate ligase
MRCEGADVNLPPNDATMTPAIVFACAWLKATAPGARLTSDSRRVGAGDVFFAYAPAPTQGILLDGRDFIDDAIARGAAAVVFDDAGFSWDARLAVPHLAFSDLQASAGLLASAHYGKPGEAMFSVAVTGTNGKTSCTQWLAAALSRKGPPAVVIGTFGVGLVEHGNISGFDVTGYTTPDALQLQGALAGARARGATALAIEASSIGLEQDRMRGLHVDVALFTNLTRDHLDYHGDMAAYEAAKTRLFDWPGLRHAVINLDDPMGLRLVAHLRASAPTVRLTGYSTTGVTGEVLGEGGVLLTATDIRGSHAGTQFQLHAPFANATGKNLVRTHLVGDFNVSNVLGVLGVLLTKGMAPADAIAAIESLQPVAGRMQQIGGPDQPLVVIDYAHTPDALQKTLASLRHLADTRHGALWCVFGCGGDRDPGKRPQMGAISRSADHVVVTSDNPRNEVPAAIIADIVAGITGPLAKGDAPHVIEDRATAILWALRHASKADVILLAGKGHESFQEIRGRKLQFLDADHAALALAARATMKGTH